MQFFVLQLPGATGTGFPLMASMFLSPIRKQHFQFACVLQGVVLPIFLPSARDLTTDNMQPIFGAVFFTNWKSGLVTCLNELVFNRSSSCVFNVLTNLSSVPKQETTRIGFELDSSVLTGLAVRNIRSMFSTLVLMFVNILLG